jgi:quinol monooxygenase YgiN
MIIVAGHITVEPRQRESYLAGCVSIVEQGRETAGCLDFAITADLIDQGRVNIFERWESRAASKRPAAAAAPATSKARQCSRHR